MKNELCFVIGALYGFLSFPSKGRMAWLFFLRNDNVIGVYVRQKGDFIDGSTANLLGRGVLAMDIIIVLLLIVTWSYARELHRHHLC